MPDEGARPQRVHSRKEKKRSSSKRYSNADLPPSSDVLTERSEGMPSNGEVIQKYATDGSDASPALTYKELKKMSLKNQRKKSKSFAGSFADRLSHYTTILFESGNVKYKDYMEKYYYLEDSWNLVVKEDIYMPRKLKMQQHAIWEFLTTERNFIRYLRVVVEVFQQYFKIIQSEGDLIDIEERHIFANVKEILLTNDHLWNAYLIKVINKARTTKYPIKPSQLLLSFDKFQDLFRPYIDFCLQQDACLKYLRELSDPGDTRKSESCKNFKEYLKWCEGLNEAQRYKLVDLLTEPMKRLTRYPLLIKKILKETKDEIEFEKVNKMLHKVESFISNINQMLRKRFEQEKLQHCLEKFEYFSTMEAANEEVKWTAIEFLRMNVPNLQGEEQRCILKSGPMKIVEKKTKHETSVEAFLFTDAFVLAKYKKSTNKLRIIKQLFYLDKIKLIRSEVSESSLVFVYLDEFDLLSTTFMLDVDESIREVWVKDIERAKQRYQNAKAGHGSTLDFFQDANFTSHDLSEELNEKEKTSPISSPLKTEAVHLQLPNNFISEDKTASWLLKTDPLQSDEVLDTELTKRNRFKSHHSDGVVFQSLDGDVRLRTCSSVPEIAKIGSNDNFIPVDREVKKTQSLCYKSENYNANFIRNTRQTSDEVFTSKDRENSQTSFSSEGSTCKVSDTGVDANNNKEANSKIRHLIYGKFFYEFENENECPAVDRSLKHFKTASTQTEPVTDDHANDDLYENVNVNEIGNTLIGAKEDWTNQSDRTLEQHDTLYDDVRIAVMKSTDNSYFYENIETAKTALNDNTDFSSGIYDSLEPYFTESYLENS